LAQTHVVEARTFAAALAISADKVPTDTLKMRVQLAKPEKRIDELEQMVGNQL